MGIDNFFRALPFDDELVNLARGDKDIAEDALFPAILSAVPVMSNPWVESHPLSRLTVDLVRRYPNIRDWHLPAGRWEPLQFARILYNSADGAARATDGEASLEASLALKFVQGDRVFSEHFKSTTGFPIRVSSPEVVRELYEFSRSVDAETLPEGYRALFAELSAFYGLAASHGGLAVFVMRD